MVRLVGLLLFAGWITAPYYTHGIMGGGDSLKYTNAVTDFVIQAREHGVPVWIGQTEFAMYGAEFPPRFAPLLQYECRAVDILSGSQLPPFFLLNLVLAASLTLAFISCYFCLSSLVPDHPNLACFLSLLYGACPAVIGLAYAEDLDMSCTTLPMIPVVVLCIIRLLGRDCWTDHLLLAVALSAAWLGHPPIAMWCAFLAAAAYAFSAFRRPPGLLLRGGFTAALLFLLLTTYSLVAAHNVAKQWWMPPVSAADILFQDSTAFPGLLKPLPRPVALENLQPGYSLLALAAIAAAAIGFGRDRTQRAFLLGCAVVVATLVLPIPFLTAGLWHLLSAPVRIITNTWPIQRLGPIFAAVVVFLAALSLRDALRPSRSIALACGVLLAGMTLWSVAQAAQLARRAATAARSIADSARILRPENLVLSASTYGIRSLPPRYLNVGVMDPEFELHLLHPATLELLDDNWRAILPGLAPGPKRIAGALPGILSGKLDANPGILDLMPLIEVQPGKRYLLGLDFLHPEATGVLILRGRTFYREYPLPLSGESRAFGSGPESVHALSLSNSTDQTESIQVQFIPTGAAQPPLAFTPFAHYTVREFDPTSLPLHLESLSPFQAVVRSSAQALFESPRLWLEGYHAQVDGREAPVGISPDGFVTVPVGPGRHRIALDYVPPLPLRLAYWTTAVGWLAVGVAGLIILSRKVYTSISRRLSPCSDPARAGTVLS